MLNNSSCTSCELHKTCKSVCIPGSGSLRSKTMIIGQNPGVVEDEKNTVFISRAGSELDKILDYISLHRALVYITNGVKCHTVGNRAPTWNEVFVCAYYLREEIKAIRPKYVLTLGATAIQTFYAAIDAQNIVAVENGFYMKQFRGRVVPIICIIDDVPISLNVVHTYHPMAYVYKKERWEDTKKDLDLFKNLWE